MSNSPLVSYVALSPNHSGRRNHDICKITPHYVAGNCTVETLGDVFMPTSRRASSNYGIGSDGRVGMYVEEDNRAWTSGSSWNDNRAVTIEVANYGDGSISNAAWATLVELCADICMRNGIEDCSYTGGTDGVLTMHQWFQSTDCPGPWLDKQFERLSAEVNARIGGFVPVTPAAARNNTRGGKLDVDGYGGYNTVLDMQHALGTWEDGVISGQWRGNAEYLWAFSAVEWGAQGSQMVVALQRHIGAVPDGIWGQETSEKLQDRLIAGGYFCGDSGADGYFGRCSMRALQQCLNDGRLV